MVLDSPPVWHCSDTVFSASAAQRPLSVWPGPVHAQLCGLKQAGWRPLC